MLVPVMATPVSGPYGRQEDDNRLGKGPEVGTVGYAAGWTEKNPLAPPAMRGGSPCRRDWRHFLDAVTQAVNPEPGPDHLASVLAAMLSNR